MYYTDQYTTTPRDGHEEAPRREVSSVGIFPAIERLVEQEKIDVETAREISKEIDLQTLIAGQHRMTGLLAHHAYLTHGEEAKASDMLRGMQPDGMSFQGSEEQIGQFIMMMADVAHTRFSTPHGTVYRKTRKLAFDFGQVDQFGDWKAPEQLDRLVELAADEEVLKSATIGEKVSVVKHDRNHPKLSYEFMTSDGIKGRRSIVVVRKRPTHDIVVTLPPGLMTRQGEGTNPLEDIAQGHALKATGDDPTVLVIQVLRKSSFIVSASAKDNPNLYDALGKVRTGVDRQDAHESHAQRTIREFLNDILISPDKENQAMVLPCSITYIAQVMRPVDMEESHDQKSNNEESKHDS